MNNDVNENIRKIRLVVSDFDGVMTDNRVLVDENGKESVMVSRADGQGINTLRELGIEVVILSTETNGVVTARAKKLGVVCIQSVNDKGKALSEYCVSQSIDLSQTAYIGNDINDYGAMKMAGLKIAPKDAYSEIKDVADIVTETMGGFGVIREIAGIFSVIRQRSEEEQICQNKLS